MQRVERRNVILRNARLKLAKVQDHYTNAVNKKRRDERFAIGEKVWLDSRNSGVSTEVFAKWSARWIGPFLVKKMIHQDVYVLDIETWPGRNWHLVFHVAMLKKYYKDDKNLHLWQEDSYPPPKYELWDGIVGKILGILDSRQLSNRSKQYKCLLYEYTPFEYE